MPKVRVKAFSVSIDGFGAAVGQSLENPFGVGGMVVGNWSTSTKTFHEKLRTGGNGSAGIHDDVAAAAMQGLGAWILGRNMFSPVRGPWPDLEWKGWWGPNPPYHTPVFVLTHHAPPDLKMEGGTVFHFVTGDIREALDRARAAAGDRDVHIGGGAAVIRQYLRKAMKAQKVTPAEMARRMKTSRPTVYRLLDPAEPGATLDTLARASVALGLDLEIRLVPRRRPLGRRTS